MLSLPKGDTEALVMATVHKRSGLGLYPSQVLQILDLEYFQMFSDTVWSFLGHWGGVLIPVLK
jgi:hypothetical protein